MMEKTLDRELKELKSEIADLREDISKIIGTAKNYAEHKVASEVHAGKDHIADYLEKSHELWADVKEKFDEVTTKVEEHPFISIMIAFGVGYAIAKISTGKAKNDNTNSAD